MNPISALDRVRIVLVETSHTGNMGSAARAMKTMGLTRLYLVNPRSLPDAQARAMASSASDVLANAPSGGLLLTIQVHMNVIAVALHAGLAGVVFTSGMRPDEAVAAKALEEKLPLFASKESTFDAAGKLYALGLRGGVEERDGDRRAHG